MMADTRDISMHFWATQEEYDINQIARHLHDTGRIYDTDLEEILGFQKETATRLNDILTKLSALK